MKERMTKEEFKKWLKARTRTFAVQIFRFVDELPKATSTQVISYQLAKSASSMGANYREATRAESGADLAHKIGIAEKESDETLFWLEVLSDLYPAPCAIRKVLDPLMSEADELLRLFASIKIGCTPAFKQSRNPAIPHSRNS
jgi:four helix bundle protein